MKDCSCSYTLRFKPSLKSLGYNKTALLLKSVPVVIVFLMTGCAHTEKYLHPEKTFSLDNLSTTEGNSRQLADLPLYETCADQTSIHSPVIWVPLIGPAIDVSMSSKNDIAFSSPLDNALIFLPLIGPAISFSGLSPKTCTYKAFHQSTAPIDPDLLVPFNTVIYIANIADQNCAIFLNRLSSSKEGLNFTTKALSDTATAAAAGTAFVTPLGAAVISTASLLTNKGAENLAHTYFGGQLIPAIKNNIVKLRDEYRFKSIESIPSDAKIKDGKIPIAELIHRFDQYDKTCSVQNAIDNLNNPNTSVNK
ncbi:MAG: hypothetical protein RLZZ419_1013 [Pseudomonadota bacterium]